MKITINAENFRNAMTAAALSAEKTGLRFILQHIHMELEDGVLSIVTLDGYRLYKAKIRVEKIEGLDPARKYEWNITPVKIPRPKVWVNAEISAEIDGFLTFTIDGQKVLAPMMNGEYVQWKKLLKSHDNEDRFRIAFNRKYLIEALNQMDSDRVILDFGRYIDPVIITDYSDVSYDEEAIVLPVRM